MVRKSGRPNFCVQEVEYLLDSVEEFLPISLSEWDRIADLHAEVYPDKHRTADALKRKFWLLYNASGPTGKSNCPAVVRRAKAIRQAIIRKTDGSSGGSENGSDDDEDLGFGDKDRLEPNSRDEGEEEEGGGSDGESNGEGGASADVQAVSGGG